MLFKGLLIAAVALVLAACSEQGDTGAGSRSPATPPAASVRQPAAARPASAVPTRTINMAQIARGGTLYQKTCAGCHGEQGQGAPNWHKPGPDGKYLAPPLNGTGHAWHHPMNALRHTIKNGTLAQGGSMPPWKDTLSDQDVDDIIAWFQSKWPNELYAAWHRRDQETRR